MEFRELIKARYSVRRFSDRPVEPEKLNAVLEAGRLAPTAKNIQPVRIYVAQSEKALAIMNEASPCIYGAKTVLVICSDESTCWVTPWACASRLSTPSSLRLSTTKQPTPCSTP